MPTPDGWSRSQSNFIFNSASNSDCGYTTNTTVDPHLNSTYNSIPAGYIGGASYYSNITNVYTSGMNRITGTCAADWKLNYSAGDTISNWNGDGSLNTNSLFIDGEFNIIINEVRMCYFIKFTGAARSFGDLGYVEMLNFSVEISKEELARAVDVCDLISEHKKSLCAKIFRYVKEKYMSIWNSWIESGHSESSWIIWNVNDSQVDELSKFGANYAEEQERKEKERIELLEIEKRLREQAKQKAQQLLKEVIGEINFSEYQRSGQIEFITSSGTKYILYNKDFARNIDVYKKEKDEFKRSHRLCAHLSDKNIPIEDNLVAQVLMLQYNEDEFLRMANTD